MILSVIELIIEILFGVSFFRFFDFKRKFSLMEFSLSAAAAGIIFGSLLILCFALVLGSLNFALLLFNIFAIFFIAFNYREITGLFFSVLREAKKLKNISSVLKPWVFVMALIITAYFLIVSSVLFRDSGGHFKAALVGWGDTALHLSLIQRFAATDPFVLSHPLLGGANLTYPFLIDFISGIFLKLNADMVLAFSLPIYVLGVIWILLIFSFANKFSGSKFFASLAVFIILLGGGLGFSVLYRDLKKGYEAGGFSGMKTVINNPPHEYTHLNNRTGGIPTEKETKDNIVWIVPLVSFFAHQRSFALGLAIFAVLLLAVYYYGAEKNFWRFAVFLGILPFSHGHTLIAAFLLMAALFLFYIKNWKSWIIFAFIVAVLALPQILYFRESSSLLDTSAFKFYFGWMTCEHNASWFYCDAGEGTDTNVLIFWLKNFGFIFIIWGLVLLGSLTLLIYPLTRNFIKKHFNLKFMLASFLIFTVANIVLFQPWSFDNNKILFYWWLLAVIFGVIPLLQIIYNKVYLGRLIILILTFLCVASGAMDVYARIISSKDIGYYGYADSSDSNIKISNWIKNYTKPNDLFITNPSVDSVPVFLAGRPVYIAFEGWLWSEGLDYNKNKTDIYNILSGNISLACERNVKYIYLDSGLRSSFSGFNESGLLAKTKTVYDNSLPYVGTKILEITCP